MTHAGIDKGCRSREDEAACEVLVSIADMMQ